MNSLRPLVLALALVPPTLAAESWLAGPGPWQRAVEALAHGRFAEAAALQAELPPGTPRAAWLTELLTDREDGDTPHASPVARTYSHHNIWLFVRREGASPAGVAAAFERADHAYRDALAAPGPIPEELRWAYAGLLHDGGRGAEAARLIESTRAQAPYPSWGVEGPPDPAAAATMNLGRVMLFAYYHCARGDRERTLDFLRVAARADYEYVRSWSLRSDDFAALAGDPGFEQLFERVPETELDE